MLHRMIKIYQFMDLFRLQAQRLDQSWEPIPDSMSTIGDKQDLIGLLNT